MKKNSEPLARCTSNLKSRVVTVRWVTETLHRRGLARLVARDRRQLSLVDCVSFEFMEEEGIQQALALDRDFEDEGFDTLPSQHRGR